MEIIVAQSGGFCRGVKNAVDTALAIEPKNTYIYGEIIHNPEVVASITARGIVMVERLSDVPEGATLIIRSHGVGRAVYEECEQRKVKVVDCTCEFVLYWPDQATKNRQYNMLQRLMVLKKKIL